MIKTTISVLIGASLVLLGPQIVHARGCGGARASGTASGAHGGSYSGSRSVSGESSHGYGSASGSYNRSYEGSHGGSAEVSGERGAAYDPHGAAAGSTRDVSATGPKGQTYNSQEERGAAAGPDGAAAGSTRDVSATGAKGQTYNSQQERGAAAGPNGAVAGGSRSTSATGAYGQTYSGQRQSAAGYSTVHTALPTDAGYGTPATRTGSTAYAGYHQTEAVSGGVYAARGATVRSSYNGYGMYGDAWHAANPGAWAATGWKAGYAWTPATWPTVGASMGWAAGVQPVAYDYGNNVTYRDDHVYYGSEPVATADQYYQQASKLAQSASTADAKANEWIPLGVFAFVQKEQSDAHYVMQLAVNKSGAIGGNYSDVVSGTNVPIQGAVDKKSQRAAWTVGKNKNTVCETGIYNLTQDETPALLHLGKDKTQQWLLVRLKQPEQSGSEK